MKKRKLFLMAPCIAVLSFIILYPSFNTFAKPRIESGIMDGRGNFRPENNLKPEQELWARASGFRPNTWICIHVVQNTTWRLGKDFRSLRNFLWVWVRVDIRGRYIGYIGILQPGYLGDMVADVATIGPDGVPVGDGIFGAGDAVDGLGKGPGIRVRPPTGRQADLIPVPDPRPGFGFCKVDAQGNLIVTVKNQGTADAGATTLKVEFLPGGTCTLPVPPIPAGGSVDVGSCIFPAACFNPDCNFRITVDSNNDVSESNEGNNIGNGLCIG